MHDMPDVEFRWLERGDGEPVVLLHGLMGRMDHWEAALEHLGDTCRPMALSLPIFDRRLEDVSIDALAQHVVRFLDALDIGRAVIGGNSLGGHVALAVALACPSRVSGLILVGSSGLAERGVARRVPRRPTADDVRARLGDVVADSTLVTPAWVSSILDTVSTPWAARRVVRFARATRQHRVEGRLHEIRVPTLLVWGREDRVTPPGVAERFLTGISDARLSFLLGCGHVPMLERPDAFNDVVAGWLEATRARRERPVAVGGGVR
jgi:pimeloyl-ACP methyl ester carboxylesterase